MNKHIKQLTADAIQVKNEAEDRASIELSEGRGDIKLASTFRHDGQHLQDAFRQYNYDRPQLLEGGKALFGNQFPLDEIEADEASHDEASGYRYASFSR